MRALFKTAPLICYPNLCFLLPYSQEGALQPLARFGMLIIAWWLLSIILHNTNQATSKEQWGQWGPNKNFYGMLSKLFPTKTSGIFSQILWYCQRRIMWQQVDPICPVPTNRGLPHLPVIIRATTTALLELSSFACFLETPIFRSGVFCPKCAPL